MLNLEQFLLQNNIKYHKLDNNKFFLDDHRIQMNINDYFLDSDKFIEPKTQYREMLSNLDSGIITFNFYSDELKHKPELITSMIKSRLNKSENKIYARECEVVELPKKRAAEFCDENHISGSANCRVALGLGYQGKLVSVMTFGIPRFSKKYDYELIRFCSIQNTNVIGGASKLFSYFVNNIMKPGELITTYANRRISPNGTMYRRLGFQELSDSGPNYFYIREGETPKMRYDCQKHKLHKFLPEFSPDLTEYENMTNHGFYRQYDCGNFVFVYEKS